jgi:PucR-like helix-turn-helix protein
VGDTESEAVLGLQEMADVVQDLASDRTLITHAADAARARGTPTRRLPNAEVARHVEIILRALRASLTGEAERLAEATHLAESMAADRAERGLRLESLLAAMELARQVLLPRIVADGEQRLGAVRLLQVVPLVDQAYARLQTSMILAHRATEERLGRTSRARRSDALRRMLHGHDVPETAVEAGLDPARRYRCLVTDGTGPLASQTLDGLLDAECAVGALIFGLAVVVRPTLPPVAPDGRLVVYSPAVDVADLPNAYAHCRDALSIGVRQGRAGMCSLLDTAVDLAFDNAGWLGSEVSREFLSAFDPADERHRAILRTALTYLAEGRRIDRVAEAMHVHANTVKYRLQRFGELAGPEAPALITPRSSPADLHSSVRLWWALRVWTDNNRG